MSEIIKYDRLRSFEEARTVLGCHPSTDLLLIVADKENNIKWTSHQEDLNDIYESWNWGNLTPLFYIRLVHEKAVNEIVRSNGGGHKRKLMFDCANKIKDPDTRDMDLENFALFFVEKFKSDCCLAISKPKRTLPSCMLD